MALKSRSFYAFGNKSSRLWLRRIRGLQCVRTVQRVALRGQKSSVGDNAPQFFLVCPPPHSSRVHYVFLNQYASHVIRAELQSDLANLDSRRQPTGLNVVDVIQIQPADRQRL